MAYIKTATDYATPDIEITPLQICDITPEMEICLIEVPRKLVVQCMHVFKPLLDYMSRLLDIYTRYNIFDGFNPKTADLAGHTRLANAPYIASKILS